jgi:chromosomal replication initiator protein
MQLIFDFPVQPRFSFDNFVVCGGNKTAYHFANRLASDDGTENLLYIYGPQGSGKTHLLTSICDRIGASYVSLKGAELFYPAELQGEGCSLLADRFADAPALVVDDLHLLPDLQEARVELWELFNGFYTSGKKIVMAGLMPPKELPHLDGHLTSRLLWGLVAAIDVSDDDSRRMILKKLAEDRQIMLPDEVVEQILLRVRRDIPSLLYALEAISRLSLSSKRKITPRLAKEAMEQ